MKRPAAESIMKKPSSSSSKPEKSENAGQSEAKPGVGPVKGPALGTEKVLIDQGSISLGLWQEPKPLATSAWAWEEQETHSCCDLEPSQQNNKDPPTTGSAVASKCQKAKGNQG